MARRPGDIRLLYHHFEQSEKSLSFAVRNSRFPHMCHALLRFPHLSFIPPVPYPPLRGTFPMRGRLCIGDSDTLVYDALETIFSLSFIPLSPSNLRPFGTPPSIGRRECPREPLPLEGAAERSEAGLAFFFAALGSSRIMTHLRRFSSLFFIPPEPYPARSARHLPHAGKALSVVILFSTYACIRFDDAGIAASSYRSLPH